jgi:hypothetical protein
MPKVETTINIAKLHRFSERLEKDQEFCDAFWEHSRKIGAIRTIQNGERQPCPDDKEAKEQPGESE